MAVDPLRSANSSVSSRRWPVARGVEGAEDSVLAGGEALLRQARPLVFLELHGGILRRAGRSPQAVLERLATYGYRRLEIAGRAVTAEDASAMDVARIVCRVL